MVSKDDFIPSKAKRKLGSCFWYDKKRFAITNTTINDDISKFITYSLTLILLDLNFGE